MATGETIVTNPTRRGNRWLRGLLLAAVVLAGVGALAFLAARPWMESVLRQKMLAFVESQFASHAELRSLKLSLLPHIAVSGEGFVLRFHNRTDLPPFISLRRFAAEASLLGLLRAPRHIRRVRLEGLEIHVPPREARNGERQPDKGAPDSDADDTVVDELVANGTLLDMVPRRPEQPHHIFHLYQLTIHGASASQAMTFDAALSNPKPPGLILTRGRFGPWYGQEPSLTPVAGNFHFEHADLGVFSTIAGTLSSDGSYKGVLERIEVDGHTDTPDFMVRASGQRVRLRTTYHSIVDGTNGDTVLDPVIADFLGTRVIARGSVTQTEGTQGRTVLLDVKGEHARMEDLLALGVKARPAPLSGAVEFQTKFRLPPGPAPTIQKLFLDGNIGVRAGRFANRTVQDKVDTLSAKARGKPKEDPSHGHPGDDVLSNFQARYRLQGGLLTISRIAFTVPGAHVLLHGNCTLASRALDFRGTLRLEAKLSQTTTGIKSVLLKLVDPFFKKKDGTLLPIKVEGTLMQPSFGLNLRGS